MWKFIWSKSFYNSEKQDRKFFKNNSSINRIILFWENVQIEKILAENKLFSGSLIV